MECQSAGIAVFIPLLYNPHCYGHTDLDIFICRSSPWRTLVLYPEQLLG